MEKQTPTKEQKKALEVLKLMSGFTTQEIEITLSIIKSLIPHNTTLIPNPSL